MKGEIIENGERVEVVSTASDGLERQDVSRESIYSFENQGRRKFADHDAENAALDEFAKRLRIPHGDYSEHRETLLNFILNHHKVISRYKELRARETRRRVLFTAVSLMLLFVIPLVIFALGAWFPGDKGSVIAQMTAVLTGIVAVHKSFSSWLDKRKVIGNFWKAESDLKTKLYAFEDKWRGKTTEPVTENGNTIIKLKEEFLTEARTGIKEARDIVRDEQAKFFEAVTYPSIDLGDMLKGTGDGAKALVTAYAPPELEQREKKRQAMEALEGKIAEQKDKIARLETESDQRKKLIEKKRQDLQNVPPKEQADALKAEIQAQQTKVTQAEDELIIARALLESLLRSRAA